MKLPNNLNLLLLLITSIHALPSQPNSKYITPPRSADFAFGSTPVRGLNIGGWLVLEPWITPSIFESLDQSLGIVDEYTLTQHLGTEAALEILQPHWNTWCNFTDFQKIANSGFNTVRIPVGYWAYSLFDGESYTQGSSVYIDAAINWARIVGLKIWIDLHGAPGSQNGFDNSGHKVETPGWQQGDTVAQTLEVIKNITSKYAQASYQDVVVGIELINEPLSSSLNLTMLQEYYRDGFELTREVSDTTVILQDGFNAPNTWNGFLSTSDDNAQNVVVDHHEYQCFTNELVAMENWEHRQYVCNNAYKYEGADKWVVVGEWSAAETDCATYLNGYGIGARYDGSYPDSTYVGSCSGINDISSWDDQMRGDVRGYIEAQLETFERVSNGWIFWNFKTENSSSPEWDAFALIDAGLFPQPLTDRWYSSICT